MVWHIFRKDLKLLWPMAAGVALLNITDRHVRSLIRDFLDPRSPLHDLEPALWLISLFAMVVLIGIAVHQDAIPGLRQDWLVRPIRRRDLFLGKLLFVVLAVVGPLFADDVVRGLRLAAPVGTSIRIALLDSVWMLLVVGLPALALGAITRSLAGMVGAALAAVLGVAVVLSSAPSFHMSTVHASVGWVTDLLQVLAGLAGAAVVLVLQYAWRRTTPARLAFGATVVIAFLTQLLPWQQAFAIQQQLSTAPAAAEPVRISFDPAIGRSPKGLNAVERLQRSAVLHLPIHIDGIGSGRLLIMDRIVARFWGVGASARRGRALEGDGYEVIEMSEERYRELAEHPVRLELDYSLTLLNADDARTMRNSADNQWIPEVGGCSAEAAPGGKGIDLHCVPPGHIPCVKWFIQNYEQLTACRPDYSPFAAEIGGAYGMRLDVRFPVANPADESPIKAVHYRPEAHFTRHVVVENFRVSDWRVE